MSYFGTVYWITGLSGAGKTTVGQALFAALKSLAHPVVFLDGDQLRDVLGNYGYEPKQRLVLSQRYSRLCKLISEQGIDVVIATISMFHETRAWNRNNIDHYLEIYLKVPLEILRKRDSKSVYSNSAEGELGDVVGLSNTFEEPLSPDLVVENYGDIQPEAVVKKILQLNAHANVLAPSEKLL